MLEDNIHQTLGQRRVVLIEVMPTRQLHGFTHGGLVGAAALVDFFGTVDAHDFFRRQLGHFRAGGGFFAGVAKTPIAALIMVAEMTGGYSLIVPMLVVSSLSFLLLGNVSLYEKQVATRVDSPAHIGDFAVDIMDHLTVRDAVVPGQKVETIHEGARFEDILRLMAGSIQQDFPVVDGQGTLTGILSITDLREAMASKDLHGFLVAKDIAIETVITVTLNDSLNTALRLMADADIRELPVVAAEDPGKVVALVSRKDIIRAYHDHMGQVRKSHITTA